jgi:hypothetical protein
MATVTSGQTADVTIPAGTPWSVTSTGEGLVRLIGGAAGAGFTSWRVTPDKPLSLGPFNLAAVIRLVGVSGSTSDGTQAAVSGGGNFSGAAVINPGRIAQTGYVARRIVDGTLARLKTLQFGDSVSGWVSNELQASLTAQLQSAGAGPGAMTATVSTGGAATAANAFDVWPSGGAWSIPSSGSVRFGRNGSTATATYFAVWIACEPGAGAATVELLDSGGTVQTTIATNTACAGALGAVIKISTTLGAAAARHIRVTAVGGAIRVVAQCAVNTLTAGTVHSTCQQGGITLTQATSATALANFQAVFSDSQIQPDCITYSMRESAALVNSTLPALLAAMDSAAPLADFIFTAPTAGSGDAGLTEAAAGSYLEGQALLAIAQTRRNVFVDSWSILGNYEKIIARDSTFDGAHVSTADRNTLALHFFAATGLGAIYGAPASANLRAYQGQAYQYEVNKEYAVAGSSPSGRMRSDNSNSDLNFDCARWLNVYGPDGTTLGMRISAAWGGGSGAIFPPGESGFIDSAGQYARDGMWGLRVNPTTGAATLYGKVSGTLKSVNLGTLA